MRSIGEGWASPREGHALISHQSFWRSFTASHVLLLDVDSRLCDCESRLPSLLQYDVVIPPSELVREDCTEASPCAARCVCVL